MENITLVCFATFCVELQWNSSHEMMQNTFELYNLEKSIDFNNEWLNIFENKLTLISDRDITDILNNASHGALEEHAYPALDAVLYAVDAAIDEGRNTYHCYSNAARIIESAMIESNYFDTVLCMDNFIYAVKQIKRKVKLIRKEIEHIRHYFNETVPSCYNAIDAVECFTTTLYMVKNAQRRLEQKINYLISEKETSYSRLKNDFKTCSEAINTRIENASKLAQREGIQCAETTETPIHQST